MKYKAIWMTLKSILAVPNFPDPEQTRAARWLNAALLILAPLIIIALAVLLISPSKDYISNFFLVSDVATLIIALAARFIMRRGFFKTAALLPILTLFIICTYINVVIFQSIRSPNVLAYFALIPLVGLLLGRRSMNIFSALCIVTISAIFYAEWIGVLIPSQSEVSIFNDLVVLFLTVILNTVLLNASIRRAEEKTEEIRQTAAILAGVNQELQASQTQLQQAQAELEQRVEQRTEELRQSNTKLQKEIKERQTVLDALRTSEANWRSLVEYLPEIIATINRDCRLTFINRTVDNRIPETVIGDRASNIHTQAQYQVLLEQSMTRVFETGETVSYESEEKTEQGSAWYINRVGAIKQEGQVVALILILTDITEQKQAEAAMYQAQKLESLGILAGGVAHDFNNLLTAMLIQMSIALTKLPPDHPVSQHINRTIKAAERATELTRQMLNYSGRSPSETKPMELNDLIMDNIHLFSAGVPKTIRLDSNLSGTIPLMMGDKGQIQQLIMNLILNSADAIGKNSGQITVVTDIQELTGEESQYWKWTGSPLPAGRYVRLEVRDTGSGMDMKTLTKIFDPFFTTKFTGRGLGLASVLGIIRAHKGGLYVASSVGNGTTFVILFPATTEGLALPMAPDTPPPPLASELVLVIDDEEIVRDAMADVLSEEGLQVLKAADGPAGIQLFRKNVQKIKLVLLDLSMPGMSGEQVLYELRAIEPEVPILLVSGYSEHEIMDGFVNKGLAGFIQKPFTIASLLQQIRPHLHTIIQHEKTFGST